jgi:hypothetical protein
VGESVEERGVLLVGAVDAIEPKGRLLSFNQRRAREDSTLQKVLEIIEPYRPRVVSDQHQGDAVSSFFGREGLAVDVVHLTGPLQTAAFTSTRTRLMDGSLRLWRHQLLLEELRRTRARNSESILLSRFGGGHSDIASALCLATYDLRHVDGSVEHEAVLGRSAWSVEDALDPVGYARGGPITGGLLSDPL